MVPPALSHSSSHDTFWQRVRRLPAELLAQIEASPLALKQKNCIPRCHGKGSLCSYGNKYHPIRPHQQTHTQEEKNRGKTAELLEKAVENIFHSNIQISICSSRGKNKYIHKRQREQWISRQPTKRHTHTHVHIPTVSMILRLTCLVV